MDHAEKYYEEGFQGLRYLKARHALAIAAAAGLYREIGRLVVQTPMYLAGWVEVQGIVKIVMGYPLFLAAAYFTYRLLAPILARKRAERSGPVTPDDTPRRP